MNTMFKVNKRSQSIEALAETLNNCNILLDFYVEDRANVFVLHVETDQKKIEYKEFNVSNMRKSLYKLKEMIKNKDDIDEIIKELPIK